MFVKKIRAGIGWVLRKIRFVIGYPVVKVRWIYRKIRKR